MYNYFPIILLVIQIIKSQQNNDDKSYLNINDKFSYMQCSEDNQTFNIYLGNELIYINFQKSENIIFNKEKLSFSFIIEGKNRSLIIPINDTRINYNSDGQFIFVNNNSTTIIILKNGEDIEIFSNEYNISIKETSGYFSLLSADNEYIFVQYFTLSNILALSGCFISLYGGYHFLLSLMIHIFILVFFFIGDIISLFAKLELYILFLLFFCFLLSATITIIFKINIENIKIMTTINLMFGGFFGFSTFKIITYYYIFFEFSIDFIGENMRIILYFISLIIFIGIGITLNFFDIFKKYRYLPCSAVSGSFYIIKGLEYNLGGYFSSILFIKEGLKFVNLENEILNYSLTYFFINIIIIASSIVFQIKYINEKEIEDPENSSKKDSILSSRESELAIFKKIKDKTQEEAFIQNRHIDASVSNESEEEEVNDQED